MSAMANAPAISIRPPNQVRLAAKLGEERIRAVEGRCR